MLIWTNVYKGCHHVTDWHLCPKIASIFLKLKTALTPSPTAHPHLGGPW
jgi:hypothetical protein